jgi:hypothetical protein
MRRAVMLSTLALTSYALAAWAQAAPAAPAAAAAPAVPAAPAAPAAQGIKLSDVAGTWTVKTLVGPKDSVVITTVVTQTADGKGATMQLPNHEPIPVRVVATGGDSVVTEAGPYPSALRPGQTVTLLRSVGHYKGDAMWGTVEAHYASGDVFKGKTAGTRKK